MREMAPIGEMAPGCGKRSKKEIFNCIFAPPSERWHRVRSQRCKSKSECYRTGPTRWHQGATPLAYHYYRYLCCFDAVHAWKWVKLFSFDRYENCTLSTKLTTHIRYMPPTAPQITEGARMVLRYLVQTRQDKNDSGKLEAQKKSYATNW